MAAVHLRSFARTFALSAGAFLLLFGILGFVGPRPHSQLVEDRMLVDAFGGNLFGLFPVNLLDNIHYILLGLLGLALGLWNEFVGPRMYARGAAVWFGLLAIMGLFPVLRSFFVGLMPLWGWDVALHFVIAGIALFMGYWPFWVPNEAYDEGDADESGRPGVPKRPHYDLTETPPGALPAARHPVVRPRAAAPDADDDDTPRYRPPRFDAQGNPIP